MVMGRNNNRYVSQPQNSKNDKKEDKAKASGQTEVASSSSSSAAHNYPTPRTEPKTVADEMAPTSRQDTTPTAATSSQQDSTNGTAVSREQRTFPEVKRTDEMKKAAQVVAAMKDNIAKLSEALDAIGSQAALVSSLHESMKIQEEVEMIRNGLQEQIARQTEEVKSKYDQLKGLIEVSLTESMREVLNSRIRSVVQDEIARRVTEELHKQVPGELKTQAGQHAVCMYEIDDDLYNIEAKRHNAQVKRTSGLLKPIRIPKAISRSSSGSTATPSTAATLLTPHNTSLLLSGISPAINNDDWSLEWPMTPNFSAQDLYRMNWDSLAKLLLGRGENVSVAKDDQEHVQQVNKAVKLIGAKHHFVVPPRSTAEPPRRQAAQNVVPEALLSPIMLATL